MVQDAAALSRGIHLFNNREFYECHEVLEDAWRPARGPDRLFLQALIHFAVSFYHHQQQNPPGAERQLQKGLRKLAGYLPEFQQVDTRRLYAEGQVCLEQIRTGADFSEFPKIKAAACGTTTVKQWC